MIKINLLPHREEKRKQQIKDFYSLLLLSAIVGALIAIIVGAYNSSQISMQSDRVNFIKKENAKLDNKIKEIVDLRQEIDALKARQQAVEDLQGDRNQPVFLLSELVKYTPEGVYLGSLKQEVQKVTVVGYAQSQERVADYIRNLSGKSEWMYKPELVDIHSAGIGQGRDAKKVYEFTINAPGQSLPNGYQPTRAYTSTLTYHSDFVCNQPHVLVIARTRRQLLFELLVSATPDKRLLECISPIHSAKKLVDYDHPANLQQLVAGLSRHQFLVSDRRFL